MNMFSLMESRKDSFSKTDRLICNAVNKFPDEFASASINHIIEHRGFSQPSLTRFAKKLGFSGFNEFQYQFRRDLLEKPASQSAKSRAESYADELRLSDQVLTDALLEDITDRIMNSTASYLYGTSLSRMPAEFLAESLRILGVRNVQALPADAYQVPFLSSDLFLCFSAHSGHYCAEAVNAMRKAEHRPYSVLVTMNPKHPLRSKFDQMIVFPEAPYLGNKRMILNDTLAFMMFIDRVTNLISMKLSQKSSIISE
ncbi:MAG: MurR/RpiR family transcriptional regulator [Solobacterium sp.]|nr:MurR/RpiR family transcriptional regulator [Solobacterium sp.]